MIKAAARAFIQSASPSFRFLVRVWFSLGATDRRSSRNLRGGAVPAAPRPVQFWPFLTSA